MKQLLIGIHHSKKLQRHYNKYGGDDLIFEIIESGVYLGGQHLLSREQGWMYHFKYQNTWMPYFNNEPVAGSSIGIKRTPETCRRIGDSKRSIPSVNKGKKFGIPPRTAFKKGDIPWNKGKKGVDMGSHINIVVQYDKNGLFIKEWDSIKETSASLGISPYTIYRMCRGYTYKKANMEFVFKYKKDTML